MILRVVTFNLNGAAGYTERRNLVHVADALSALEPDIVAVQEVADYRDPVEERIINLEFLAKQLKMHWLPGFTRTGSAGAFGNGLLSRFELHQPDSRDISVSGRERRLALQANVQVNGHTIRLIATHLGLRRAERAYQVRILRQLVCAAGPSILLGDLNEWLPWTMTLGALNPARSMLVSARRTFPSRLPLFPLDRIFVKPEHWLKKIHVSHDHQFRELSDHLPLVAVIDVP